MTVSTRKGGTIHGQLMRQGWILLPNTCKHKNNGMLEAKKVMASGERCR